MKNIIFLSADQHHFSAFSSNGNTYCKTPNLDRLKNQSVDFELSYSASPLCGPARGSWFSGMMPSENGVTDNIYGDAMRKDYPTLGQWIAEKSNYSNFYAGKWHVGDAPHMYNIRGFDVICSGINRNGIIGDASISVACEGLIRNYKKKNPFYLTISYTQPHDICETIRMNTQILDKPLYGLKEKDLPPIPPISIISIAIQGLLNRRDYMKLYACGQKQIGAIIYGATTGMWKWQILKLEE